MTDYALDIAPGMTIAAATDATAPAPVLDGPLRADARAARADARPSAPAEPRPSLDVSKPAFEPAGAPSSVTVAPDVTGAPRAY